MDHVMLCFVLKPNVALSLRLGFVIIQVIHSVIPCLKQGGQKGSPGQVQNIPLKRQDQSVLVWSNPCFPLVWPLNSACQRLEVDKMPWRSFSPRGSRFPHSFPISSGNYATCLIGELSHCVFIVMKLSFQRLFFCLVNIPFHHHIWVDVAIRALQIITLHLSSSLSEVLALCLMWKKYPCQKPKHDMVFTWSASWQLIRKFSTN